MTSSAASSKGPPMPHPDLANAPDSCTSRTPDSGPWAMDDGLSHRLRAAVYACSTPRPTSWTPWN